MLVLIRCATSIGTRLQFASEFPDAAGLIAAMVVILAIGLVVDNASATAERPVLRRPGLLTTA